MKYIFGIITTALIALSFIDRECEHVFTQVEQSVIKIEPPYGSITLPVYHWPSGMQDGKDIICVKCFHVQKQKIDYGQPCQPQSYGLSMPEYLPSATGTDSCKILGICAWSIKADTMQWNKVELVK